MLYTSQESTHYNRFRGLYNIEVVPIHHTKRLKQSKVSTGHDRPTQEGRREGMDG